MDTVDLKHEQTLGIGVVLVRIGAIALPVVTGLGMVIFVTGVGGYRGGWLWAPLITTPPLAAVGFFGWGPRRGRKAATAVLATAGLALGTFLAQNSVLSAPRLREAHDVLALPEGYVLVSEERNGWALCFDECTSLTRTFAVRGDGEESKAALVEALQRQGFTLGSWREGEADSTFLRGHRGRLGLNVTVLDWTWREGKRAALPPGELEIRVTLRTYGEEVL